MILDMSPTWSHRGVLMKPNCLVFRFFQLFIKCFTKQLQPKNISQHSFFGNEWKKQQQNQPLEMKRIHRENFKKPKTSIFRVISILNLQIRFFFFNTFFFFNCSHHKEMDTNIIISKFISSWNSIIDSHLFSSLHQPEMSLGGNSFCKGTFSPRIWWMDWRHRLS